MLLNLTDFAQRAGVSRAAVYKAIKIGRVVQRADRKINIDNKSNAVYLDLHRRSKPGRSSTKKLTGVTKTTTRKSKSKKTTKPVQQKNVKTKSPLPKKASKAKPKQRPAAPTVDAAELKQTVMNANGNGGSNGSGKDENTPSESKKRLDAELEKIIATTKKTVLEIDIKRSAVIDRTLVQAILGRLATIDVNEFITIAANVGSAVSALLGVDDDRLVTKATKLIEDKLYSVLQHRQKEMTKFLEALRMEFLKDETP